MDDAEFTAYVTTILDRRFVAADESLLSWTAVLDEFKGSPSVTLELTEQERAMPAGPPQDLLIGRYSDLRQAAYDSAGGFAWD